MTKPLHAIVIHVYKRQPLGRRPWWVAQPVEDYDAWAWTAAGTRNAVISKWFRLFYDRFGDREVVIRVRAQ